MGTYFVQQIMLARMGYQVNPDAELLCYKKASVGDIHDEHIAKALDREIF